MMKAEEIKKAVKDLYGKIAVIESTCCSTTTCCGTTPQIDVAEGISRKLGYSAQEIQSVPAGSNLGLGCGNPTALAALNSGETVLDLGSGAGFDVFLAAQAVGKTGKVIGVDMTPEMIEKARRKAEEGGYDNVEFRLGEIEELPVADESVDVVLSNCVINLAPDKGKVFRESYRVLKSGGRLMVSDIVLLKDLPEFIKSSVRALTGCIAGALKKEDYLDAIRSSGFADVRIVEESTYPIGEDDALSKEISQQLGIPAAVVQQATDHYVSSIKVFGEKP
jgi:arsenite methyltransferase